MTPASVVEPYVALAAARHAEAPPRFMNPRIRLQRFPSRGAHGGDRLNFGKPCPLAAVATAALPERIFARRGATSRPQSTHATPRPLSGTRNRFQQLEACGAHDGDRFRVREALRHVEDAYVQYATSKADGARARIGFSLGGTPLPPPGRGPAI